MKRLEENYTFNHTTGQVTFLDLTQSNNTLNLSRVLLITDTTTNTIIYNFAVAALGGTVSGNVLTLQYNTSALADTDKLQIYYDFPNEDSYSIIPGGISAGLSVSTTGPGVWLDVSGFVSVIAQITGSWAGSIVFETNNDASINAFSCVVIDSQGFPATPIQTNGIFSIPRTAQYIRYNVVSIQGTAVFDINGRSTSGGPSGIESLALAMDASNGTPLNVALPVALKQDASGALFWTDSSVTNFTSSVATTPVTIDTTGYQSIVVQEQTAGIITPTISNDGVNFVAVNGYLSSAPNVSIAATAGAGVTVWPVLARYFRLTGPASLVTATVYLREAPFVQPSLTNAAVNVAQIAGTASVTAGVAGLLAVGGNVAAGLVPTANPVLIGGIDTTGLTRRLLTDTSGKLISDNFLLTPQGVTVQSSSGGPTTYNGNPQQTIDLATFEGQTQIELLSQILLEMRIQSQYMAELPLLLNSGQVNKDEPQAFRNDPSIFQQ